MVNVTGVCGFGMEKNYDNVLSIQMTLLFSFTIFLGAFLLFSIQPMFAKMILPYYGGVPAVWNTCLVFFQTVLLLGYGYSHLISSGRETLKKVIHVCLLAGVLAMLPFRLPQTIEITNNPVYSLLHTLFICIGFPFFAVSATAPLLQKWFSQLGSSKNPYALYAASNLGSFTALLSYPVLVEPVMTLTRQREVWSNVYLVFVVAMVCCALAASKGAEADLHETITKETIGWRRIFQWVVWAFLPSSLLLGSTTYITSDVASIPLIWIATLAIYLLTFILLFSGRFEWLKAACNRFFPHSLILGVMTTLVTDKSVPFILVQLIILFVVSMVCHGRLAEDKPSPKYLTVFYFWMSLGGVLGGVFNALLVPIIFKTTIEYPLVLGLSALAFQPKNELSRKVRMLLFISLCVFIVLVYLFPNYFTYKVFLSVSCFLLFVLSRAPFYMCAALIMTVFIANMQWMNNGNLLKVDRSFFGVIKVADQKGKDGTYRLLSHGVTNHGAFRIAPSESLASYYDSGSPMAAFLGEAQRKTPSADIAVIGMGQGSAAFYMRPEDRLDFYEIDPLIKRIATNPEYFPFISHMATPPRIFIGDGRLEIQKMPDHSYDLIIVDAFSSDAIPVHLLTQEAIGMYFSKLKKGGIVLFHISNRYFALQSALKSLADSSGFDWVYLKRLADPETNKGLFIYSSTWFAMAKEKDVLVSFKNSLLAAKVEKTVPVWTDDFSDVLSTIKIK